MHQAVGHHKKSTCIIHQDRMTIDTMSSLQYHRSPACLRSRYDLLALCTLPLVPESHMLHLSFKLPYEYIPT